MRKYLLHVLVISFVFLSIPDLHVFAIQTRAIEPVLIKDRQGNQVGMYKGSYALIIGVSDYKAGWPDLESIPGEIEQVEAALIKMGFNVKKVMNPDSEALKKAYEDFINEYGYDEQNRLLFFYSGHGHSRKKGKKGYLVPVDAPNPRKDEKGFLRKALTMSDILNMCKKMEAKHALFLFDSCFSGTIFKAKALPKQPPHITSYTASPVRQFITAGSAGEEVPANSVFTPSFVRGLRGEADLNKDNYVTGTELGMYLHEKVLYYNTGQTPQYGKIKDPDLDEGDFVFALGRDVYEPSVQLPPSPVGIGELDFGDIEADSKNAKKLAEIKEQWATWQGNLNTAYDKALKYDKDTYLSASKKAQVWQRLANGFSQDNPYSTEDQLIRSKAMDRLKYWKNWNPPEKEEKPLLSQGLQPNRQTTNLRSSYKDLTVSQVQSMSNISIREKLVLGFYGHSTISHSYNLKSISGDKVVVDGATGLMWHQNGSRKYMKYKKAKKWLKKLNRKGYAGYHDWRLPTMEEAASLLESINRKGQYIDPVFSNMQYSIWTGDSKNGSEAAWRVNFYGGNVSWGHISYYDDYVRPVRSGR